MHIRAIHTKRKRERKRKRSKNKPKQIKDYPTKHQINISPSYSLSLGVNWPLHVQVQKQRGNISKSVFGIRKYCMKKFICKQVNYLKHKN